MIWRDILDTANFIIELSEILLELGPVTAEV